MDTYTAEYVAAIDSAIAGLLASGQAATRKGVTAAIGKDPESAIHVANVGNCVSECLADKWVARQKSGFVPVGTEKAGVKSSKNPGIREKVTAYCQARGWPFDTNTPEGKAARANASGALRLEAALAAKAAGEPEPELDDTDEE